MWFEIMPAFAIIAAAMYAPHGIAYALNWLVVGNCYRRELRNHEQQLQYLRSMRLTGDAYKVAGLENIPDEDEEVCKCAEGIECAEEVECPGEGNNEIPDVQNEEEPECEEESS